MTRDDLLLRLKQVREAAEKATTDLARDCRDVGPDWISYRDLAANEAPRLAAALETVLAVTGLRITFDQTNPGVVEFSKEIEQRIATALEEKNPDVPK